MHHNLNLFGVHCFQTNNVFLSLVQKTREESIKRTSAAANLNLASSSSFPDPLAETQIDCVNERKYVKHKHAGKINK